MSWEWQNQNPHLRAKATPPPGRVHRYGRSNWLAEKGELDLVVLAHCRECDTHMMKVAMYLLFCRKMKTIWMFCFAFQFPTSLYIWLTPVWYIVEGKQREAAIQHWSHSISWIRMVRNAFFFFSVYIYIFVSPAS